MAAVSNERLYGCAAVGQDDDRPAGQRARVSYRLPPGGFPGALPLAWLAKGEVGAASFGFSFLGFLASRLPRFSPLAMACLRCWSVSGRVRFSVGCRADDRSRPSRGRSACAGVDRPPLRFGRRGPTDSVLSRPLRAKSRQERPRADLRVPTVARAAPLAPLRPRLVAGAAR